MNNTIQTNGGSDAINMQEVLLGGPLTGTDIPTVENNTYDMASHRARTYAWAKAISNMYAKKGGA